MFNINLKSVFLYASESLKMDHPSTTQRQVFAAYNE